MIFPMLPLPVAFPFAGGEFAAGGAVAMLPGDAQMRRLVHLAISHARPRHARSDRRRDLRQPYPQLIALTPVGSDNWTPSGPAIMVLGKSLSERGLDFYHREPVPFRRVVAELECGQAPIHLLLELTWCRFCQQGWYDNGGRFLQVLEKWPAAESLAPAATAS